MQRLTTGASSRLTKEKGRARVYLPVKDSPGALDAPDVARWRTEIC